MSSNNASGKVVSVDEQAFEKAGGQAVDEDGFPVVDETPEFEAAVEQETQAKVDANHPDGIADTSEDRIHGVTLEQEERIQAREAELERISAQAELGTQEGREQRTREVVSEQCGRDEPAPAERTDPREKLTQEELAAVNEQAMRISDEVQGGWSRAVVAKQLAEKVQRGRDVTKAVLETLEELKAAPGAIVPIADVPDVPVGEVTVEGEITQLWDPSDTSISQVGLIEDDSGKIKFTIWEASRKTVVSEGETVRFRAVKKNWYQGRCSIAITGWSRIEFPERDRWWEE
ncbi:DNA-binding protein [Halorubrum ezzemoulense]|uniref:DNA-binding protein n=1 Tax=Halorubrum ezzemoulense TaxID=337243 RepID=UPI00232CAF66|nr:DNA-binding protein [Halorubrum ezzemoulense]MDB2242649.1 DNA-binding protein [Halorubrum ezzemoulense]MDB2246131.1 DNA-binding protein [Halorubrum ezzemoulense]MDB2279778.1 DNA-binding protein [Halorubrum ezzemoulense]MDB2290204.1 DNA-binding protein [Halorubrum ezzemoulense]MDB2297634.1 DNA-binding protein [Halorubrum ezzemoulense]